MLEASRGWGGMTDSGLTPGEAARRLGVAVTTLRTWHDRYGLGLSDHRPPAHRRYTPADMDRLDVMRRLTAQGLPTGAAAKSALGDPPGRDATVDISDVARARSVVRGLVRAATRLDPATISEVLAAFVSQHGVVATWDLAVRPVLGFIGERHRSAERAIGVEHLFTRVVSQIFAAVPRPAGTLASVLAGLCR
jgi:MerR family transcriptional regulator, light-induced transcriptional regulator